MTMTKSNNQNIDNISIDTLLGELEVWRNFISKAWTLKTAYPETSPLSLKKTNSAGQCVVSSFILLNRVAEIKYNNARLVLGQVQYVNHSIAISYHGWIEIGDMDNPLIVDITSDQALDCDYKIIVSKKTETSKFGLVYKSSNQLTIQRAKTQEVWKRYIILLKKLLNDENSKNLLGLGVGLDLLEIDDNDVTQYIDVCLKESKNEESTKFFNFLKTLSDKYSFSDTRTYPRPDHPDKFKRRSPTFTMAAVITSFRTTLENEQKAVSNLLENYHNDIDLLNAPTADLEKHLYSAGMAKKKAVAIQNAVRFIHQKYKFNWDKFNKMTTLEARSKLLDIPGIGEKGADCILSVGLGRPATTVDTNVFRVASRFFNSQYIDELNYNNKKQMKFVKNKLNGIIGNDSFLSQISHTLLLLHGKHVCKSKCSSKNKKLPKYCCICSEQDRSL
ncbi:hypothetical protein [uncultured Gammaproteobacteria bacterium]|nr:hypothetical protein [uncultured Gammaproteobacteria bacterium]CAC9566603.1 hypothetical protein [uncultured Gammaproteobacteria bacterium]CAC9569068.1 hypothetical protein [uncultured Gammaproteobacteria bacterium]CAC9602541.1 hypothetical protein [uncultured Gammaproteobacteria bacterium]CAC9961570.1 hypothetical protein [uncultured Gammaproteobacteria bacterium]